MNKSIALLVACGSIAAVCGTSSAATFSDLNDYTDARIIMGTANGRVQSLTDSFNLLPDGYTLHDPIVSAFARFAVMDQTRNEAAPEYFDVELGGLPFLDEAGGFLPFQIVAFGGDLVASLLLELEETGGLTYTITATGGDFRLKSAYLEATTVPDGGMTVCVLGLGLLGVASYGRLASRKNT